MPPLKFAGLGLIIVSVKLAVVNLPTLLALAAVPLAAVLLATVPAMVQLAVMQLVVVLGGVVVALDGGAMGVDVVPTCGCFNEGELDSNESDVDRIDDLEIARSLL